MLLSCYQVAVVRFKFCIANLDYKFKESILLLSYQDRERQFFKEEIEICTFLYNIVFQKTLKLNSISSDLIPSSLLG